MSMKNQTDFEKAKANVEVAIVDLTKSAKDKVSDVRNVASERISDTNDAIKGGADAVKDEVENVVRDAKDADDFEDVKEAVGSTRLENNMFAGEKDSKPSSGRVKFNGMAWIVVGFVLATLVLRRQKAS